MTDEEMFILGRQDAVLGAMARVLSCGAPEADKLDTIVRIYEGGLDRVLTLAESFAPIVLDPPVARSAPKAA